MLSAGNFYINMPSLRTAVFILLSSDFNVNGVQGLKTIPVKSDAAHNAVPTLSQLQSRCVLFQRSVKIGQSNILVVLSNILHHCFDLISEYFFLLSFFYNHLD